MPTIDRFGRGIFARMDHEGLFSDDRGCSGAPARGMRQGGSAGIGRRSRFGRRNFGAEGGLRRGRRLRGLRGLNSLSALRGGNLESGNGFGASRCGGRGLAVSRQGLAFRGERRRRGRVGIRGGRGRDRRRGRLGDGPPVDGLGGRRRRRRRCHQPGLHHSIGVIGAGFRVFVAVFAFGAVRRHFVGRDEGVRPIEAERRQGHAGAGGGRGGCRLARSITPGGHHGQQAREGAVRLAFRLARCGRTGAVPREGSVQHGEQIER